MEAEPYAKFFQMDSQLKTKSFSHTKRKFPRNHIKSFPHLRFYDSVCFNILLLFLLFRYRTLYLLGVFFLFLIITAVKKYAYRKSSGKSFTNDNEKKILFLYCIRKYLINFLIFTDSLLFIKFNVYFNRHLIQHLLTFN